MTQYGMLIDLKSCIGCKACMTACKGSHDIPFGKHGGREYFRIWPKEVELGKYPYVIRNLTPRLCMQCQKPPCVAACPIPGAIYQREDGIVLIDKEKCNGCEACISACPYNALYLREDRGCVDKCTFCVERIDEGLEPVCVKTCPADAMFFGDLDDSDSQISKLIRELDAQPLHPEYGTKPSVYYTAHAARLKGIVKSQKRGNAVQGAVVTLTCLEDDKSISTSTDFNGVFFFWNCRMRRKYSVEINGTGFLVKTSELILDNQYTDLGQVFLSEGT